VIEPVAVAVAAGGGQRGQTGAIGKHHMDVSDHALAQVVAKQHLVGVDAVAVVVDDINIAPGFEPALILAIDQDIGVKHPGLVLKGHVAGRREDAALTLVDHLVGGQDHVLTKVHGQRRRAMQQAENKQANNGQDRSEKQTGHEHHRQTGPRQPS